MRYFLPAVALALLLAAAPAPAQVVKLPATAQGTPGVPVAITATADGKNVIWVTPDAGLVVIDGGFFGGDSKKALVFGPQGQYRLWAFTAKGDVVSPKAECVVTFGAPPGPGPGPPPTPTDPFTKAVLAAYQADASPTKAADAAAWAKAFRDEAAKMDALSTYGDLYADLKAALAATRPGALPGVKAELVKEMGAAFPTDATKPLDKPAAKAELNKIAAALGGLQKEEK